MAARIVEGLFTCAKRWALEAALIAAGHRWPRRPAKERLPMSGAELLGRLLCWLDTRGDPHGRMYDAGADAIALAAHWTGDPGVFVDALVKTGWLDRDPQGLRWHGYGSLNGITLRDRQKKRRKRGDDAGDTQGDKRRDEVGDKRAKVGDGQGDRLGASVSESGDSSEGIPSDARARGASGAPASRGLAEPKTGEPPVPRLFPPHPAVARLAAAPPPARPRPRRVPNAPA